MKSSKLMKAAFLGSAVLVSCGAVAQAENPTPVKGRWGLSTGLTLDRYKWDISPDGRDKQLGILPMITYTRGKNQFELGPQFSLADPSIRQNHKYFGANFNYKRYFNGFGTRFTPYLFTGVGFGTTVSNTIKTSGNITVGNYVYNYKQTGINLSVGYGLEWQIGKGFYLGSSVSINPGIYSIRKSDFTFYMDDMYWGDRRSGTFHRFDINVNMQLGYRFGNKK